MMSTILGIREQLRELYAKYSTQVVVGARFILGLLTFGLISYHIGFMKPAASVAVTAGLAIVCAFLPTIVMTLMATAVVLLHLYALSMPIAGVTAVFLLLMYIFYFRFTTKKAWIALLTAAGCSLHLPLIAPVAIGLLGGPACLVPAACGVFTYYVLHFVKTSANSIKGDADGIEALADIAMTYTKQALANKEMWIMVAAILLCALVVYGVKTRSMDHAWKVATGAGVVAAIVVVVCGNLVFGAHIPYVALILSGVVAIGAGLLLEILFLSVDYQRTERLEFEDDEYHYYVKAVPKVAVTIPEKSVKRINERQENGEAAEKEAVKPAEEKQPEPISVAHTEELLLTRSLNKELGLDENPQDAETRQ